MTTISPVWQPPLPTSIGKPFDHHRHEVNLLRSLEGLFKTNLTEIHYGKINKFTIFKFFNKDIEILEFIINSDQHTIKPYFCTHDIDVIDLTIILRNFDKPFNPIYSDHYPSIIYLEHEKLYQYLKDHTGQSFEEYKQNDFRQSSKFI